MKNVIVTGGGTGGHLFATLAFCDYLKKEQYNPIIIGSIHGLENEILKNKEYEYMLLDTMGFAGKTTKEKLRSILKFIKSTYHIKQYIKLKNPKFVVGFGGYTTVPVIVASKMLKIKTAIVEQNAIFGRANKFLSRFADLVFTNFESTKNAIKHKKVFAVGCPVRSEIFIKNRDFSKNRITIGVMGGSRGARSINNAMIELAHEEIDINVIHQTGKYDYEHVKSEYSKLKPNWTVFDFIYDMKNFYESIDFIVCRAGASTISEITCAALGSLLIPYPYAIYNHQYYNALELVNGGSATIIEDKNLSGKSLKSVILSLSKNRLRSLSDRAKLMCKRDVCSEMLKIIKTELTG